MDPRLLMSRMTEGGKARIAEGEGNRRMDPRLLMSRMTEGGKARMTEGEKAGMTEGEKAGMTDKNKKTRHWILYLTGSPIKNVGDKRRG